jgi:3-hydroxyacyl-CoA dehydrogenase
MTYLERFQHISVLGAAGKMGSGILLLNVLHNAKMKTLPEFRDKTFVIHAIDQSFERLDGLNEYIKTQVLKWAEKNIVWLRKVYSEQAHLIDNEDIINAFVFDALAMVKPSINLESAYHSSLIFEAIIEDVAIKSKILEQIKTNNPHDPWFLTNTSSIPIHVLNEKANLNGNIIGCHFYNPPAVQKLIEVIELQNGNNDLSHLVYSFGNQMEKIMVPSNDVAGFIGNGFFMRDILHAEKIVSQLNEKLNLPEAIVAIDMITRDLMVRPMGIFQLTDYVGIDVCSFIMKVMSMHLSEKLLSPLLEELLAKGVKGGQNADGSQKPGIFQYERGVPVAVFNIHSNNYISLEPIVNKVNDHLAIKVNRYYWKQLSRSKQANQLLSDYFRELSAENSRGAHLTVGYMQAMKKIALKLVEDKVTDSPEHVNTVMKNGFYHVYGPVNDFI